MTHSFKYSANKLHWSGYLVLIKLWIILLPASFHLNLSAQQVPLFSQYMMNGFLLNPAVAGSEGYTAVNLISRQQWLGLKNAPSTHALSAQTRIMKDTYISRSASVKRRQRLSSRSGKVGLGGYIFTDRNGPVLRNGLQLSYAYHIRMQQQQLSFGLSGIFYQFSLDKDKIRFEEEDLFFEHANKTIFIPDANTGIYFSGPDFFAGFSASQLLESGIRFGDKGYAEYKMKRYYYLTAGYDFAINEYLTLAPSFLLKTNDNFLWQTDISTKLIFNDEYWGGISYRTGRSLIFMGGIKIDKYVFGYSFDYTLSSIMKHSYGSHEFIAALLLGDNTRKYRWLNRY